MAYAPFSLVLILLFLSLPSFLEASSEKTITPLSQEPLAREEPSPSSIARRLKENDERETSVRNPTSSGARASASVSGSGSGSKNNFKKTQDFYGAAAHEVPSGPNPESN